MKPTVHTSTDLTSAIALLSAFKQYLTTLGLGSISCKLYTSDIARLLAHPLFSPPTPSTLTNPKHYSHYLSSNELRSSATLFRRTFSALRRFGTFLAHTYSLPNPTLTLSTTSNSLVLTLPAVLEKYIKTFLNQLKGNQLTLGSIKSYKSDITQYATYVASHYPSTLLASLLKENVIQEYADSLTHSLTQSSATIARKLKTIRRFTIWLSAHHPASQLSDKPQYAATVHSISPMSSASSLTPTHSPLPVNPASSSLSLQPGKDSFSVKKNNYRKSWRPTLRSFLTFAILTLITATLSILSYRQFGSDVRLTAAFPTTPVTPNRQLSFQGRLENASGTPITSATNFVFKLYDADSGGTELYSSGTCSITPDTDGVFSTQIGDTCGAGIGSGVFTENADVYLEVTVASETLTPRQQIATVAYALNSETLQGFPISATVSAIRNTVVPMNQWGEIIIGEQSPRLTGVSGTLAISAPSLSLTTTTGSSGNISLAPDGTGQINATGNTTSTNFFNISNAQLTTGSLLTGTVANNNSGFKLLDLLAGSSPASVFSVDAQGDITTAGTLTLPNSNTLTGVTNYTQFSNGLSVGGATTHYIGSSGNANLNALTLAGTLDANGQLDLGDGGDTITLNGSSITLTGFNCSANANGGTLTTNGSGVLQCSDDDGGGGSGTSYWRLTNGALSPVNNTLDVLIGSDATSSAKFAFTNINSGTPTFKINQASSFDLFDGTVNSLSIESGLLSFDTANSRIGIGNTTPLTALDIAGSASASGTLTFRGTTDPKIKVLNGENFGLQFSPGGDVGLTENFTVLSNGNVGIGETNPGSKLVVGGTTSTISNNSGDLTIDSFSGNIVFGTDDDLIPTLGAGSANLGSSSAYWDNQYLGVTYYSSGGGIVGNDNDPFAFRILEGARTYFLLDTSNGTETVYLNLPLGGTGNLFTSNVTQTINLGTGTGADTINIGTGGTTADDINIGGLSTSHTDFTGIVNFAGGTTYYVDASGNAKFLDLQVSDTGNPGLTVGNGSVGFAKIGGSTISDNSGNLTLDSDSAAITFAADDTTLTASGLATIDTAATVSWDATTLTMGGNTLISGGSAANNDLSLQGTSNATRTTSYVLLQPNGGNVGINNSTPAQELDVSGDIQLSGLLYDTYVTAGIRLGNTNETALTGFGASSIVGALNELKNSDKNTSHNDYLSWANHYQARAEGSNLTDNEALNGLFFDTFQDGSKFDATNSTSSATLRISDNEYRVGIIGGQTYNSSTSDNDGQTYLGSNTVNDIYYYDRSRDSNPDVLVELGIDPNWYNGVTLSVATSSASYSQAGTMADKNPNLTTSYNGSLIKATGTDSTPRTIYITIKSPTTFDWTNYQGDSSTGVTITPGTAQALGVTGVSVTFTAANYNVGDVFKIASWYIEAEGTNRGAKQQFPERSYITAENGGHASIIDADTQKLWMRFTGGSNNAFSTGNNTSTKGLNGKIYITHGGQLRTGDFVHDFSEAFSASVYYRYNGSISQRDGGLNHSSINTSLTIVSDTTANDVDAAVIPNQPTQEVTLSGWGYIQGAASNAISESVILPYKFNQTPIITVNAIGGTNVATPTSLANCTSSYLIASADAVDMTNSSFTNIIYRPDGTNLSASYYYCYTWKATGTVSPKTYVGVGTGNGVTIINDTDAIAADITRSGQTLESREVFLIDSPTAKLYLLEEQISDTGNYLHVYNNLPETDVQVSASPKIFVYNATTTIPARLGRDNTQDLNSLYVTAQTSTVRPDANTVYLGAANGVTVIQEDHSYGNGLDEGGGGTVSTSSVKYYTKDYISEEMIGDIRGMWPLNNSNSASDFEDVSLSANNLTGTNITAAGDSVSGVRNTATDFDGSTEYMSVADNSTFAWGTTLSVGAWFKNDTLSGVDTIIAKYNSAVSGDFWLETNGTEISFSGGTGSFTTSGLGLLTGQWYHAVAVYNAGTTYLYLNGQLVMTSTATTLLDGTAALCIGCRWSSSSPTNYFDGTIDEAFVTATTLTAAQIKNMYQVGYRALQSHGTGLSAGSADGNQALAGTSNNIGIIAPDFNNQYMYVGSNHTTDGALTKIQLNSDTAIKNWDAGDNDPDGGTQIVDDDINSLAVGYQLEAVGSAASGIKSMAPDDNGNALTGSLFSKTQTLSSATKFAYLWTNVYTDSSDAASAINVYACNGYATKALCDSNNAWTLGTLIQTDTSTSPPEREYNFAFSSTGSYLTFKIDFKRTDNKANTYIERYGASWASSVGGADIAERYQSSEPVYPGDIVTIDSPVKDGVATVKKSRTPYDQKVIGVVTTNPGIVMDENLVDLNWNASSRNSPDRPAVALAGRIPVKVSTRNGDIAVGDPITTSTIPAVGVRANQSGTIVAKALESFSCDTPSATLMSDGTCEGKVLAFANITHYERSLYLSDLGDFVFAQDQVSSTESGNIASPFRLVRVLADGSREIVDKIGTFGTVIAEGIKGKNLAIETISPLASGSAITVEAPVVIKPNSIAPDLPTLVVEGTLEVATISARTATLETLEVKNLIADRITANQIEGLEATIATLSAYTTNTISETEIDSITARIKDRLASLTSPTASDLPAPELSNNLPLPAPDSLSPTATNSASFATADIDFATINNYLAVIGTATITSLNVTDTLYSDRLDSQTGILALQSSGGIINLANNTLLVDSSGQVVVNGDLTVSGKILADTAELNSLTLGTPAVATSSALGNLLAIYDESGIAVATINASGSANLADLTTQLITIASPPTATSSTPLSSTTSSNATAGEATLRSPDTELTIKSPFVTSNSLVYLTPTTNTDNKVLFVKAKESCPSPATPDSSPLNPCTPSFTVGIDTPAASDINFNWWIIRLDSAANL